MVYSSCHILDTAFHILGPLEPVRIYGINEPANYKPFQSLAGLLETTKGAPVFLTIMAENPSPIGIRIFFQDQTTWRLSPLERLIAYREYDLIEPTPEVKIRRYAPKPILEINEDAKFKPGFLGQMTAFTGGEGRDTSATLEESLALLRFTETIQRLGEADDQSRQPPDNSATLPIAPAI
jgi:hypothetical protein